MDYPEDFDTTAFLAGRRIAVSRVAGIWTMVALFLLLCISIAIPWVQNRRTVDPWVIYVDGPRGEWELIRNKAEANTLTVARPYYFTVQRALVGVFTEKWFTVSSNSVENAKMWARCNRGSDCESRVINTFPSYDGCDIYCLAGDDMYQTFANDIVPYYQEMESRGERWYLSPGRIEITPQGAISSEGGTWVVTGRVRSKNGGDFQVVAYVKVARNTKNYPQTLGYYVADFNSYREDL